MKAKHLQATHPNGCDHVYKHLKVILRSNYDMYFAEEENLELLAGVSSFLFLTFVLSSSFLVGIRYDRGKSSNDQQPSAIQRPSQTGHGRSRSRVCRGRHVGRKLSGLTHRRDR
jgi:hypothetical protein